MIGDNKIHVERAHFEQKGDFDPAKKKKKLTAKQKKRLKEKQERYKILLIHFRICPEQFFGFFLECSIGIQKN